MKLSARQRREYLEAVVYDLPNLLRRMANLEALDMVNRMKRNKKRRLARQKKGGA